MQENPTPDKPARSTARLLMWWLGVPLILMLVVAVVFGMWGANRFQSVVRLAKETQQDFQELNARLPFEPPGPGDAWRVIPNERWTAMLTVREQALGNLPEGLARSLEELLAPPDGEPVNPVRWLLAQSEQDWRDYLKAQQQALEEAELGPDAYSWMLGLVIREAIADGSEAGQDYRRTLESLARLTRQTGEQRDDFEVGQALEMLDKAYEGHTLNRPGLYRRLEGATEAQRLLDLAAVALREAPPVEQAVSQVGAAPAAGQ